MMTKIYSLFVLISIFTAYSVFAAETPSAPASGIDQKEIAQTMRNLNDLMAAPSKRGIDLNDEDSVSRDIPTTNAAVKDSGPAPQTAAQAYEKLDLQRGADILSNLEDESDSDSN